MYKVYCANQQTSLNTVEEQKKKNPQFKHYLEVCHTDSRCEGLFLQSFLIKPIQRVCKYPLLLRVRTIGLAAATFSAPLHTIPMYGYTG